MELSEFDIVYEPRGSIKGQIYADFVAELSPGGAPQEVELDSQWLLSVDGSSNQQGSGAGIVLEGPNKVLIEQALRFAFKESKNQAEYEVLRDAFSQGDGRAKPLGEERLAAGHGACDRGVSSKRPADDCVFKVRLVAKGSIRGI